MSFLYRSVPIIRSAARPSTRLFSTTVVQQKTVTETVKDGLKKVDRTVSDAAVAGIDKGIEAKDKAASTIGSNAAEAKGKATELAGEAKGEAQKVKGQAEGKATELKGKAEQKMS